MTEAMLCLSRDGDSQQSGVTAIPLGAEPDALRLEQALRESQDRYQQLVEALTTYSYTVTLREGLPIATWHSPACLATTGYSPEDYASDPYLWFTMIHPQDRAAVLRHLSEALADTNSLPVEHRILRRDGKTRWVRDTIVLHRDAEGQVVQYDGFVEDITARKCEEARFRKLVELAPDAMVVADGMGRIVLVNALTESLFGYRREDLLGQPVELLVPESLRARHADDRQAYSACPRTRFMGGIPGVQCLRKDGTGFPADISLCPIESDEGVLVCAAVRDITERQLAEQRARESELQLLAAKRIQERLLPDHAPNVPGFDIAGRSYPAELVGRDSFDFLLMPEGALWLSIGDVSGHGFAPALMMASTHAYLRSLARVQNDPGSILQLANMILANETGDERFVTYLLARLDPRTQSLVYCSAGHPTGYVLGASSNVEYYLKSGALPLGVMPHGAFPVSDRLCLQSGDTVLLVTDGVQEARSPDGECFGIQRMLDTVRMHQNASSREVIERLYDAVREYSQRETLADDLTAVVVKVT